MNASAAGGESWPRLAVSPRRRCCWLISSTAAHAAAAPAAGRAVAQRAHAAVAQLIPGGRRSGRAPSVLAWIHGAVRAAAAPFTNRTPEPELAQALRLQHERPPHADAMHRPARSA
jgi:hypothetical protein